MMNRRMLLALAAGLSLAGGAFAQSGGTPARLRGKIDAVSGDTIQLTLRNGTKASAKLPPNARVTWLTVAQTERDQGGQLCRHRRRATGRRHAEGAGGAGVSAKACAASAKAPATGISVPAAA